MTVILGVVGLVIAGLLLGRVLTGSRKPVYVLVPIPVVQKQPRSFGCLLLAIVVLLGLFLLALVTSSS